MRKFAGISVGVLSAVLAQLVGCREFQRIGLVAVFLLCSGPDGHALSQSPGELLEQQAAAYPDSGRIRLTRRIVRNFRDKDSVSRAATIEVWFDGDKLRNDIVQEGVTKKYVVANGKYIAKHDDQTVVVVGNAAEYNDVSEMFGMMHPKWLFMDLGSGSHAGRPSRSSVLNLDAIRRQGGFAISGVAPGEREYHRETTRSRPVEIPAGYDHSIPDQSWSRFRRQFPDVQFLAFSDISSLIFRAAAPPYLNQYKLRTETEGGDHVHEESLQIKYASGTNAPLIEHVVHEIRVNGFLAEETSISLLDFELDPISPLIFTLEGLGLTEGTHIRDHSASDAPSSAGVIVDGKPVLIASSAAPHDRQSTLTERAGISSWLLILNAIVLIGIGSFFALRAFRRVA